MKFRHFGVKALARRYDWLEYKCGVHADGVRYHPDDDVRQVAIYLGSHGSHLI